MVMRHLAAAAVALTAATSQLAGCVALCGTSEDYAKGTDGTWVLTRMSTYTSPCPTFDIPEQMEITIAEGTLTIESEDITVRPGSVSIRVEGERHLVDFTVDERWWTDEVEFATYAATTYSLELVPATARLEGSYTAELPFHREDAITTCENDGAATGGRVEE
jgi:hypothetical protein